MSRDAASSVAIESAGGNGYRKRKTDSSNTPNGVDPEAIEALASSGLLISKSGFGALAYEPNRTCGMFLDLCLDIVT
jgi:hypothetical protein